MVSLSISGISASHLRVTLFRFVCLDLSHLLYQQHGSVSIAHCLPPVSVNQSHVLFAFFNQFSIPGNCTATICSLAGSPTAKSTFEREYQPMSGKTIL